MNYSQSIEWLYGTQLFGIKLGLENMQRLHDDWAIPGEGMRILHVAGTNGKGSVCAMLDSICREAGVRSGLFTSPHLLTYRERIRIDGAMVSEEEVAANLTALQEFVADWETHPTFFELSTALALKVFRDRGVEIAVLETGLGGRLDATNVVTPAACALTPIALDHQLWLGESLAEIAEEKAGIIKPGVPVVSSPQPPAAAEVIRRVASEREAPLEVAAEPWTDGEVALPGAHQRENAAVAVAVLRAAAIDVPADAVRRGLASIAWRGRFERLTPAGEEIEFVIDGAHNPDAARALVETWRGLFGDERAVVVFGVVESKDREGILEPILELASSIIVTAFESPRAVPPKVIAGETGAVPARCAESVAEAVAMAVRGAAEQGVARVLVCGSLFLAGEAIAVLEGGSEAFESSAQ